MNHENESYTPSPVFAETGKHAQVIGKSIFIKPNSSINSFRERLLGKSILFSKINTGVSSLICVLRML